MEKRVIVDGAVQSFPDLEGGAFIDILRSVETDAHERTAL